MREPLLADKGPFMIASLAKWYITLAELVSTIKNSPIDTLSPWAMNHPHYQTVVVPINLGEASNFNRAIFPLSSYRKRDSLGRSDLFLDGTLDEMLKITSIGTNPQQWQELIATTKARYDQLVVERLLISTAHFPCTLD